MIGKIYVTQAHNPPPFFAPLLLRHCIKDLMAYWRLVGISDEVDNKAVCSNVLLESWVRFCRVGKFEGICNTLSVTDN